MNSENYKVLITASGVGVKLGELTDFTNKTLIKLGKKPVLSYIIESYPQNTEFVITTGYFGDQVQEFLKLAYPDKNITIVEVDNYDKEGSSLGYSMLQAADHIQCPFIYHASDTVVLEQIPTPNNNWIGGYRGTGSSHYASFDMLNGEVKAIYDKGEIESDLLHIGLVGVKDYQTFWKSLNDLYESNEFGSSLSDVKIIIAMIDQGKQFTAKEFSKWFDIGNVETLSKTRMEIEDSFHILDKANESIFIFDEFVIKFFYDNAIIKDRVSRAKILKGLVPKIEEFGKNFYRYTYTPGKLFSQIANPKNFEDFLDWSKNNLWKKTDEVTDEEFRKICDNFYRTKTFKRIDHFLKSRKITDQKTIINDELIPPVRDLLNKIDYDKLCQSGQSNFHGDFILDNIIKTDNGYCLLDWRQNFGGLLQSGDMYYDLAKLNHNLTINHDIINNNHFSIEIHKNRIRCDIHRKENLIQCQKVMFDYLKKNNLDTEKVNLLTAIIWLNMSPLHHHPFDLFLFYFGKLNLWRRLNEIESS